ncbi:MAG: hypothetical protein HYS26_04785 [Candidatus Kaiserbacteria bacterium]|nr:MAG: hypothetical protein HYS26_04785 [Candidatus Kaiserbacteria bacterium]
MTLDAVIMLVGAFVALLPFLGLPNSWDTALFFGAGVVVIGLGIIVRRRLGASTGGIDQAASESPISMSDIRPTVSHEPR